MCAAQFGEMLRRFVPLTNHDVAEILEHQAVTHRRFGEIALGWGLCRPDQVWAAWCAQLSHERRRTDLDDIGIDAQSIACVSAAQAREYCVVPVRVIDDHFIIATCDEAIGRAEADLPQLLNRKIAFVLADADQIARAILRYYGEAEPAKEMPLPISTAAVAA